MTTSETYVKVRIDPDTKARAVSALSDMHLNLSDAVRMFLTRVAEDRELPFPVKAPTLTTREAIEQLESGQGQKFADLDALMADLNADD